MENLRFALKLFAYQTRRERCKGASDEEEEALKYQNHLTLRPYVPLELFYLIFEQFSSVVLPFSFIAF